MFVSVRLICMSLFKDWSRNVRTDVSTMFTWSYQWSPVWSPVPHPAVQIQFLLRQTIVSSNFFSVQFVQCIWSFQDSQFFMTAWLVNCSNLTLSRTLIILSGPPSWNSDLTEDRQAQTSFAAYARAPHVQRAFPRCPASPVLHSQADRLYSRGLHQTKSHSAALPSAHHSRS